MPDILRIPMRMECNGIDLVHPIDRMPPGSYPYLFNVRVLEEGRIDGRPGYSQSLSLLDTPNSIRRLNDSTGLAVNGYIYVGGGGTKLYAGVEGAYNPIDVGYSGDPLSLIPFRPDQSPQSWMYVWDRLKSAKVRPDGVIQGIGATPPTAAPGIEYGTPANVTVTQGNATAGWTNTGTASGGITLQDRTRATPTNTIGNILYNSYVDTGINLGWCCIQPIGTALTTDWMGQRMQVTLNNGGLNSELVTVREIHPPIPAGNSVASIIYDDQGSNTGHCSIEMVSSPPGLSRNSLLQIGSELVRVMEVNLAPNGQTYSFRTFTNLTHLVTAPVTGVLSLYCYTTLTHNPGETITDPYIQSTVATGAGGVANLITEDASMAGGRPISEADDYLHISVYLGDPSKVTQLNLLIDVDQNTSSIGSAFTGNYWSWAIPQAQLVALGTVGVTNAWTEIIIPISSGTRHGGDLTRTFSTIKAVQVQLVVTGSCDLGFDNWYFFGTYGPTTLLNALTGYNYASRYRNSQTGVYSVPSPVTRYQLFPLRESVIVTPAPSSQVGIDDIDIYRIGGSIASLLYVGTASNVSQPIYIDALPDSFVNALDQPVDLTAIEPWPVLIPPILGTCDVAGTSIKWKSGPLFPLQLLNNTAILINGQAFLTYGQPRSQTFLEITQDAGSLTNATFQIASPTLFGQPLPFVFGPLEGPFAPVIFGLGDQNNPGLLYFTNQSNADAASDLNTIELSTPSSGLVSGAVWNGLVFAGSRDQVYCVRYSYLTSIGATNNNTFQFYKVPCPSGIWSRWACCACPLGIAYLGRDGIYISTDTQAVSITDEKLYPLFPHDGQPAAPINSGSNIILPVDMSQVNLLRLSYCDEALRFSYIDTGGNYQTLIFEIYKKRWFLNNYSNQISYHYLVEQPAVGGLEDEEILMLSRDTNSIMRSGGNNDNGAPINSLTLTPSFDGGDERAQKLYVDTMTQADGTGDLHIAAAYDNAQSFSPVVTVTVTGGIQQYLQNISSLADLTLHRNIGCKFAWTGGPAGPRLYAWEMSGFLQPYLSTFFVTQFIPFSFPGWKHMRRMFPALISNNPVLITFKTQDGRTYGPYTIASTGGQYRIVPQMLDHGIKDLAFAIQLDGQGQPFAIFPSDFTVEVKQWVEETYINLAVLKA